MLTLSKAERLLKESEDAVRTAERYSVQFGDKWRKWAASFRLRCESLRAAIPRLGVRDRIASLSTRSQEKARTVEVTPSESWKDVPRAYKSGHERASDAEGPFA